MHVCMYIFMYASFHLNPICLVATSRPKRSSNLVVATPAKLFALFPFAGIPHILIVSVTDSSIHN